MRRPPRRGRKRHRDDVTSNEFTLFQLLDINVGNTDNGVGDFDDDIDSDEEEEAAEIEAKDEQPPTDIPVPSTKIPSGPPPSIFDALFDESEKAQRELALNETVHGPSKPSAVSAGLFVKLRRVLFKETILSLFTSGNHDLCYE